MALPAADESSPFGEAANVEQAVLPRLLAQSLIIDLGGVDKLMNEGFQWPQEVVDSVAASSINYLLPDFANHLDFKKFAITARAEGIRWDDLGRMVAQGIVSLEELESYSSAGTAEQQTQEVVSFVVLPCFVPGVDPPSRSAGNHPSHFFQKFSRVGAIGRLIRKFHFLPPAMALTPQSALAPSGIGAAAGVLAVAPGSVSDFELPEEEYNALIRAYCIANRDGLPFPPSVTPTRVLVGKVLKAKNKSSYSMIPLKFCFPASTFELKELSASQKGLKRIQLGGGVFTEISQSETDYTRFVSSTEFLSCVKVLGTAYAVTDVVPNLLWQVHLETITAKVAQFPDHIQKLCLAEQRLRSEWATHVLVEGTSFINAIKYFQQPQASAAFWMETLYMNPETRLAAHGSPPSDRPYPFGAGKGNNKNSPRKTGTKSFQGTGSPQKVRKVVNQPKGKGKGKAGRNPPLSSYSGPFKWRTADNKPVCFGGASTAGCKDPKCRFQDSHGLCPLPACNGARHSAQSQHPQEWAEFAAAGFHWK